jgi:hypothetical protein
MAWQLLTKTVSRGSAVDLTEADMTLPKLRGLNQLLSNIQKDEMF